MTAAAPAMPTSTSTSMPPPLDIALIGCGRMGGALLRGWLAAGLVRRADVIDPGGLPAAIASPAVRLHDNVNSFAAAKPSSTVFVIAVKPQIMDAVCRPIAGILPPDALTLSIAAGQTISSFEKRFSPQQPVVRAMPNTPAAIGRGMTVAVANKRVSAAQRQQAGGLLQAVGAVAWVEDEKLLDPVTALSGSGPAYVFLLIETLARAGEKAGLPPALALTLARQTVTGSAALAENDAQTSAEALRRNVTSPGGTTEAALKILMDDNALQTLFDRALAAATARAKELSR